MIPLLMAAAVSQGFSKEVAIPGLHGLDLDSGKIDRTRYNIIQVYQQLQVIPTLDFSSLNFGADVKDLDLILTFEDYNTMLLSAINDASIAKIERQYEKVSLVEWDKIRFESGRGYLINEKYQRKDETFII